MIWVSLWFVLITLAATFFALLGVRLFRQAKALTAELSRASQRLADVSDAISASSPPAVPRSGPEAAKRRRKPRHRGQPTA